MNNLTIREHYNISYMDKKKLNIKEHCEIYRNIEREILAVLRKYDIEFVLVESEQCKDLIKERNEYKQALNEIDTYIESLPTRENKLYSFIPKDVKKHIQEIIDKVGGNEE